ncbi:hypothetical protein Hypma_003116 [Hypsizygus marmoreus]|uniref:Uncharacterized protein n=1 Tax=Hypsizygus marmoreus TaxID=39966 RepID=A0A369J9U7_HYPMA|nr:hypothetical protein Hypma_003116 [Hypsizygus marmoreus]
MPSATESDPEEPPEAVKAELNAYKRRCAVMSENLSNLTTRKRAKRPPSTSQLGRGIPKLIDMFEKIGDLVIKSDKHDFPEPEETDVDFFDKSEEEINEIKRDRKRCNTALQLLGRLIPNFSKKVDSSEPEELNAFYAMLENGSNDARSEDISKLKTAIANWLNATHTIPNPLLDPDSRFNRGLQHDITGRLLCPIQFDWDDEEVRAKLRACEKPYQLGTNYFLRCLYQGPCRYDDVERGFLKSALLVKTFMFIFTSPSSAKAIAIGDSDIENTNPTIRRITGSSKRSRRKDVASGLHMQDQVTPRSIAYAVVQLVFALTDAPSWVIQYNGIDLRVLYYFVIDFFEVVLSRNEAGALLNW